MKGSPKVSVRCRYYKSKAAKAVLDHADANRSGFTNSDNVHWERSVDNIGYYFHCANSCTEALDLMCQRHKEVTGKKIRVDNNILFEHVLCLSEKHYSQLEELNGADKVKQATMNRLKRYAKAVKAEFGFEPLGIDFHLDEGRYEALEGNRFVRNVHAHIQFINYDYSKKIAPLRYLMAKGLNKSGKTNSLNPHFEKMQDLAFETFKDCGFQRGESKSITNKQHLSKEQFVKQKIQQLKEQAIELSHANNELLDDINVKQQALKQATQDIAVLESQLDSLRYQVANIHSLKADMVKVLAEGTEKKLKEFIEKKLAPAMGETSGTSLHREAVRTI
ncbi:MULTISPECIES: hypothetical protein [Pseudoalteromonas]|uniref:hypothetical protein n=1 Tax=Pseudoalteromonas TaxID=53246 RepID=UPI001581D069|nr:MULTISPECIES: hypothetical protein [Pseudoalteromonas]MDI4653804.1 hypothetical protein [Pseudoalteromonas shioyasakiensis]NUJ40014.1 hypothetical protein [Pseudoalteromonas sp. 0303]